MLTEEVEYFRKIEEKVKAMKNEIKGTNSEEKETGTQLNGAEGRNKHSNQNTMKKQEFIKMRSGLGTSRTTLNIPTSES